MSKKMEPLSKVLPRKINDCMGPFMKRAPCFFVLIIYEDKFLVMNNIF